MVLTELIITKIVLIRKINKYHKKRTNSNIRLYLKFETYSSISPNCFKWNEYFLTSLKKLWSSGFNKKKLLCFIVFDKQLKNYELSAIFIQNLAEYLQEYIYF